MKISLSLLALFAAAIFVSGCDTLATRRSLYSPKKGDGYWTRTLHDGSWRDRGTQPTDETIRRGGQPTAPAETAPVPPPPAPPASTPVQETPAL